MPWMKLPIIILLLNILVIPIFGVNVSLGMFERPLTMDTTTIRSPAKVENILMKPEGVGLPSELKALSKSNALMIKAIPKMLSPISYRFLGQAENQWLDRSQLIEPPELLKKILNNAGHKQAF